LLGPPSQIGLDGLDHRHELAAIDRALRHVLRHDNLRLGINGGLSIIGLHEPVFRFHDPAFAIAEIPLRLGVGFGGRWRGGLAWLLATLGRPIQFLGTVVCTNA
jgi:hypothetical protein